jgi:hypothetical protein
VKAKSTGFGELRIEGERYRYDVVIDAGRVRRRRKGPSKALREEYGHTPLTLDEDIPWGGRQLIVGTGVHGRLFVAPEVYAQAARRGIDLKVLPTPDACRLLAHLKPKQVFAVLHATC